MLSVYGVIKMAAVGGRVVARGPARTLPRDWVPTAHFQLMIPLTNVSNKCPSDGKCPCGTFTIADLALSYSSFESAYSKTVICGYGTRATRVFCVACEQLRMQFLTALSEVQRLEF